MTLTRRHFLQSASGLALALPWLPSVMGEAIAQTGSVRPKRFIAIFSSNGQRNATWYPTGNLPWQATATANCREVALSQLPGQAISTVLGSEFHTLKSKLLLVRGLNSIPLEANHGGHHMLSANYTNGVSKYAPTMDQYLARSSKIYPSTPANRLIYQFIKGWQNAEDPVSVTLSGDAETRQLNASAVWDKMFVNFQTGPARNLDAEKLALRTRVIDQVKADYDRVRAHPRLSSEDRQKLERHVAEIASVESRVAATATPPPASCVLTTRPSDLNQEIESNLPTVTRNHIDTLVAGLKCDRCRVFTLQLCPATDLRSFGFIGLGGDTHHNYSHDTGDPAVTAILGQMNNWYAKQVAYLLAQLDVEEEPGRTYLDNSLVFWGNEYGMNAYHQGIGFPALLAGGKGAIKTGRYLDYRHQNVGVYYDASNRIGLNEGRDWLGRPYNQLLVTLMQAMGLAPADYEKPGVAGFGDYAGDINGQYSAYTSDAQKRAPLPEFFI